MLDSSTTAGFLVPHIAAKKEMTLFTNNLLTANAAINAGIRCFCLGGESVNHTAALGGYWAYTMAASLQPDIFFFSSYGVDEQGEITDPTMEENSLRQLMLKQAKTTVFLCDSQKIGKSAAFRLINLSDLDYTVFDEGANAFEAACTVL